MKISFKNLLVPTILSLFLNMSVKAAASAPVTVKLLTEDQALNSIPHSLCKLPESTLTQLTKTKEFSIRNFLRNHYGKLIVATVITSGFVWGLIAILNLRTENKDLSGKCRTFARELERINIHLSNQDKNIEELKDKQALKPQDVSDESHFNNASGLSSSTSTYFSEETILPICSGPFMNYFPPPKKTPSHVGP